MTDNLTADSTGQAGGWDLRTWTKQVPMAHSSYYIIPDDFRPRHTKVGRKVIVLESPKAWLERVAKLGGVPSKRKAA